MAISGHELTYGHGRMISIITLWNSCWKFVPRDKWHSFPKHFTALERLLNSGDVVANMLFDRAWACVVPQWQCLLSRKATFKQWGPRNKRCSQCSNRWGIIGTVTNKHTALQISSPVDLFTRSPSTQRLQEGTLKMRVASWTGLLKIFPVPHPSAQSTTPPLFFRLFLCPADKMSYSCECSIGRHCALCSCTNNQRKRNVLGPNMCLQHSTPRDSCKCEMFALDRFPTSPELRHQWIAAINRKNFLFSLPFFFTASCLLTFWPSGY